MLSFYIKAFATLLIALAGGATVFAQKPTVAPSSASRINRANEMVREGKIDEAIESYKSVIPSTVDQDQLNYNLGVAQYRKDDIEAAESLFTKGAASPDPSLASNSRYNLGNCLYAKALQNAERDKPAAMDLLRGAIEHYRGSLRGNPDLTDARANIELAGDLLRKLKDQQKQDQQKQDQQKQDQQKQDQQKHDRQKQDQDENSQSKQEPQQNSQDQQQKDQRQNQQQKEQQLDEQQSEDQQKANENKQDQQNGQQEDQQKQTGEQKAQQENDKQESKPDSKKDEGKSQDSKSDDANAQQPPKNPSSQNKPKRDNRDPSKEEVGGSDKEVGDQQNNPPPSGDLTAAGEKQADGKPMGSGAVAADSKEMLMTKEEALKMLQSVRDRDMLRRLRQEQRERLRHVPTDRDW